MPSSSRQHEYGDELIGALLSDKTAAPARLCKGDDDTQQHESSAPKEGDVIDKREEMRLRREREEEESIELARQLMAEEAMASYQQHFQFLRDSADQLSQEDYDALQNAIREEEHEEHVASLEDNDGELSYEAMLELGERIGDVKTERWAMIAKNEVKKLPTFKFDPSKLSELAEIDDSEHKCLICHCEYESSEELRRLPCGHCFHSGRCIDQWLMEKDFCPYCRQCVVQTNK